VTAANGETWMLLIKVIPNSSRNEVVGLENGELKIKINAVPEDGKANKELLRFLSKKVGISKTCFDLLAGETSRHKRVQVCGIAESDFYQRLDNGK